MVQFLVLMISRQSGFHRLSICKLFNCINKEFEQSAYSLLDCSIDLIAKASVISGQRRKTHTCLRIHMSFRLRIKQGKVVRVPTKREY
jgi:hypothetical protein